MAEKLRPLDQVEMGRRVTADYILAGGILPEEMDGETSRACEEIMAILHQCDARQLRSIGKIAQIYADEVRMK